MSENMSRFAAGLVGEVNGRRTPGIPRPSGTRGRNYGVYRSLRRKLR